MRFLPEDVASFRDHRRGRTGRDGVAIIGGLGAEACPCVWRPPGVRFCSTLLSVFRT
jgi:hypothetical protein